MAELLNGVTKLKGCTYTFAGPPPTAPCVISYTVGAGRTTGSEVLSGWKRPLSFRIGASKKR